jgi:DNA-binding NarL/FixJ family response regulator
MIRLVIVDDHKILRQGVRRLLDSEADIEVVGEADNASEGYEIIGRTSPDVAVVDIGMKGMNGIDLTKLLKHSFPKTQVVILSMHDNPEYVNAAFRAGAKGYVFKSSGLDDLASAIRTVFGGQEYSTKSWKQPQKRRQSGDKSTGKSFSEAILWRDSSMGLLPA